jgi:hypothetical protein
MERNSIRKQQKHGVKDKHKDYSASDNNKNVPAFKPKRNKNAFTRKKKNKQTFTPMHRFGSLFYLLLCLCLWTQNMLRGKIWLCCICSSLRKVSGSIFVLEWITPNRTFQCNDITSEWVPSSQALLLLSVRWVGWLESVKPVWASFLLSEMRLLTNRDQNDVTDSLHIFLCLSTECSVFTKQITLA